MFLSSLVLARLISSSVIVFFDKPSMICVIFSNTGSTGFSRRTEAMFRMTPGSFQPNATPKTLEAMPDSTRPLYSRPAGSAVSTC